MSKDKPELEKYDDLYDDIKKAKLGSGELLVTLEYEAKDYTGESKESFKDGYNKALDLIINKIV